MPQDMDALLSGLRAARKACAEKPSVGKRMAIPRPGKPDMDALLYVPQAEGPLPLLVNMHGGAWIGGDAMLMESFCRLMADELPAAVINLNYKKADEHPFPYAVEEVADTVRYFIAHAAEYSVDPAKIVIGGHSAGGQLAAGAAVMLADEGVKLAGQMLVYPCVDMTQFAEGELAPMARLLFPEGGADSRRASPLLAETNSLRALAPAIFIECGLDELRAQGVAYAQKLIDAFVPVCVKQYPDALHGFLEVNRPDYPAGDPRQTPEQAAMARDCERYLVRTIRALVG